MNSMPKERRRGHLSAFLVLGALIIMSAPVSAKAKPVGNLTLVKNGVFLKHGPRKGWKKASEGAKLFETSRIKTKSNSRAQARLLDGSMLRLGPNSELAIEKASLSSNQSQKQFTAKLVAGKVWASVTKMLGYQSHFRVKTTNAVAGVRGTRFQTSVESDGSSKVKVYAGQVLVSNKPIYARKGDTRDNRVEVAGPEEITKKRWDELVASAMQFISVSAKGKLTQAQPFEVATGADKAWEAWNLALDKAQGFTK